MYLHHPDCESDWQTAEYIIVTNDDYTEEANKLAAHHRTHSGLKSVVLTLSEIYDDFSAGNIDIVTIRNAVRYMPSTIERTINQSICAVWRHKL